MKLVKQFFHPVLIFLKNMFIVMIFSIQLYCKMKRGAIEIQNKISNTKLSPESQAFYLLSFY